MGLVFWWLLLVWVIVVVASIFLYRRRKTTRRPAKQSVAIAHSERLTALPSYQRLFRRYQTYVKALLIVVVAGVMVSAFLSARPTAQNLVPPQQKNRDIMLCLDVSGSMASVDKSVFDKFYQLASTFDGQRIGLTTFNSSAVTIFPLTDDYDLVKGQLAIGRTGFGAVSSNADGSTALPDFNSQGYTDYSMMINGTNANDDAGASLVGDGLASCIDHMGTNAQHRSQSIILATDNEVEGTQIITVPQDAALAKQKGIRLYALDPGPSADDFGDDSAHTQLQSVALETGGAYYNLNTVNVSQVIDDISKQEATYFAAAPELVSTDIPLPFLIALLVIVVTLFILAWRLEV